MNSGLLFNNFLKVNKPFLFALAYGLLFYVGQFVLSRIGILVKFPSAENLRVWDASFYYSIGHGGYDPATYNTGFFPLFAWIWRFSYLETWGIVSLNIVFFSLGFAFLMKTLNEHNKVFWLLCLTTPAIYYAFVPLSEALFFLLASISLWAVVEKKTVWIFISLFLLSLTRSVGIFLLPGLFLAEIFQKPIVLFGREFWKSCLRFLYRYALPIVLALGLVMFIQYQATGDWMIYYKTQSQHWDKGLGWPRFPLNNIENGMLRYGWLNALALFIDALAMFWLVKQAILWLSRKTIIVDVALLISMCYLTMVLITILFFNPRYETTQVMGANRYTYITPFFFVFLHYVFKIKINGKIIIGFLLLTMIFWVLFTTYHSPELFVAIGLPAFLLILAFLLGIWKKKFWWCFAAVIVFDFVMQLHYFQQFIQPLFTD